MLFCATFENGTEFTALSYRFCDPDTDASAGKPGAGLVKMELDGYNSNIIEAL